MIPLKKLLTKGDVSIKEGWKQLEENGYKTLFVVDACSVLIGSVTDGDIRRWILADRSIQEPLSKVMHANPIAVLETDGEESAKEQMLAHRVECIPVVDVHQRVKKVLIWDAVFKKKPIQPANTSMDVPVVIMAGGRGVRLDPFTRILPKPLIPIGEKPILEVIIDKFSLFGVKNFFISLNYRANMIKAYFEDIPHEYEINYFEESMPSGTAGSLHMLRGKIDQTFIVSNCDVIVDANYSDILKFHQNNKCKITLVCSMRHFPIPYGVVEIENGGMLKEIREKPEFDFLINTGLYVMEPELLNTIPNDRVFHITHLIDRLKKENERIGVYPVSSKSWMDVGEMKEYKETLLRFQ